MTIERVQQLATQQTHMNLLEDMLLQMQIQLKQMRQEHEEIMQSIIKDNQAKDFYMIEDNQ